MIDGRYGRGAIVLTTNRAFDEWPELFDNSALASATLNRLSFGETQMLITGDTYRAYGARKRQTVRASVSL